MNLDLLKHAKGYIEKLANGINPLTGENIPETDIINNIRISRCLFYVNNILGEVLSNGGIYNPKIKKIPFYLSKEEINKFEYVNEDLSISKIIKRINNLKSNENMVNLKASDVCRWLISIGLLTEIEKNGKKIKIPTETGKNIGMYIEHRISYNTEYDIVIYKRSMQEFIIDNFGSLLDFLNKENQ